MFRPSRLIFGAALAATAACASAPARGPGTSTSALVSQSELAASTEANLYDFVSAHRPRWLQPRTSSSIPTRGNPVTGAGANVSVYLDASKLGGLEVLKSLSRNDAKSLRFYDLAEAQQRFPNRETGAVIQVITK